MKPDEDYEDLDDNAPTGNARAMSWMVLAVAVGGFAALAYYAYNSGNKSAANGDMVVIEADKAPIKEAPANPEGEQFPNKDKTIYDVIAQDGSGQNAEKLMPESERPVAAANTEDEDSIAAASDPVASAPVPATPAKPVEPASVAAAPATAAAPAPATTTYVAEAKPAEPAVAPKVVKVPEEKSYAAPEMINEKKVAAKSEETKPAAKKEVKSAAKPAAEAKASDKPSARGAYKLQLGAFKSEAEAQAAWKKINGKYGSAIGGSPVIVKVELPKGTFYRLRAGSFASSDAAKAACASMGGQACFPVK